MDKNSSKIIKSISGYLFAVTPMDTIFNGWFLMKTSQVSTRGVSFLSKIKRIKKQTACGKIAVQFFSLQAGYPVCGFCFESIPSKYIFMKNALMYTHSGSLRLLLTSIQQNIMYTTLLT
jgi:hypothetical protein